MSKHVNGPKLNPEKLAELLARESKLPLNVAKLQLSRTNFDQNIPSAKQIAALQKSGGILNEEDLVRKHQCKSSRDSVV